MSTKETTSKSSRKDMVKKITLKDLNPHVICVLCRGYFIDPVTIVECLHSFCKTCIVEHIKQHKNCPVCDTQINKTKPYLSMRLDKALQNMVYKLVPGLYTDEMDRRKKFQEKHEPTKVPKAELEKHFFFCDDKISMSLEYFDTEKKSKNNNNIENEADNGKQKNSNPNKRYLSCPGTVKIQHLMKFITMKYGLNSESFVVDVIYKGDIIPQDYTLIDVAYYYKWEKEAPMQFFYRIFKKNKVLLKRRKRKSLCEDKISDPKKAKTLEVTNNVPAKSESKTMNKVNSKTNEPSKNGEKENDIKTSGKTSDANGGRTVKDSSSTPPSLVDQTKKDTPKVPKVNSDKVERKESKAPVSKPPTLKPALAKEPIEMKSESEDEDDKPPSEKKLKIDLKPEGTNEHKKIEPIKIPDLKKNLEKAKESVVKSNNKVGKEQSKVENPAKSSLETSVKPCIPKLINPSSSNGSSNNKTKPNMLNNIVNNLTKKLTESSSPPPPVKPSGSKPPSTLLGGQTTITKKDSPKASSDKSESKEKSVKGHGDTEKKPKGIPPATSVTLKTMSKSPSSTSSPTSSVSASMSFSNSFKSKNNGSSSQSNSMMSNFIQPRPTNGLSPRSPTSPTKKNSTSTLSDLRTFRKDSGSKSGSMPKSPITPSLTSRTLTLGNTKKSNVSSSNSPTTTSSFSSTLAKPLPKPGEASSANNLLAAQAQISALASLGLTTGLTEAQKEYIKNLTAAANMSNLASALFQQPLNHLSLPPSQQLPSNRLKLTMQSSKNSVHHPTNPLQMLPSLASHMAPESQWKSFSSHYSGHHGQSSNGTGNSPKMSSLSKTLNQSIRQIPNPSLLTKQASEQQQLLQVQRALAASQAAAAISSGSSLSQR